MPHITHTPADMVGIIPTTLDPQNRINPLERLVSLITQGYTYEQAVDALRVVFLTGEEE